MNEIERHTTSRALVASFLFTDLVGYSKGTAAEQFAAKETLSSILRKNLATLLDVDYRIKDTGDGALIAFTSSPEHALYMALAITHDFSRAADEVGFPSHLLRTGLHLGSVKESTDLEARPNFVGDGINAAKRIMDFAQPGQITASRAFFDAVGSLDAAYADLFRRVGAPNDKHGRAHELYAVAPSATVLGRLRLDLAPADHEPAGFTATSVAPITPKQQSASRSLTEAPARPGRSRTMIHRVLFVAIAIGTVSLFMVERLNAPDRSKNPQTTGEAIVSPTLPKPVVASKPIVASPTLEKSVSESQGAPASVLGSDAAPPVGKGGVAERTTTFDSTLPVTAAVVAPTSHGIKSKTDVSPAAPGRTDTVTDTNGPRCSRILEKATLGEKLTAEETKELASSCR